MRPAQSVGPVNSVSATYWTGPVSATGWLRAVGPARAVGGPDDHAPVLPELGMDSCRGETELDLPKWKGARELKHVLSVFMPT